MKINKIFFLTMALLSTTAFAKMMLCPSVPSMNGLKGSLFLSDSSSGNNMRWVNKEEWVVSQVMSTNKNPVISHNGSKPPIPLYFQQVEIDNNSVTCKYAISQDGNQSILLVQPKSFPKLYSYGNNWATTSNGGSICKRSEPGKIPAVKRENCEFEPRYGSTQLPAACLKSCVTPFGAVLGTSAGVDGYSNCSDECDSSEENFQNNIYTGMPWQCVEYSRRWLQSIEHVSFASVDAAYQIWDLPKVTSITDKSVTYPFISEPNGGTVAPKAGDLIIYAYEAKEFPAGHVGVIVKVNTELGYADIAEENYTNGYWANRQSYARRIQLKVSEGTYTLTDIDYPKKTVSIDGKIIGWKHIEK